MADTTQHGEPAAGRQRIFLETQRLLLRPWKKNKADAKELYRYAKDPKVGPRAGWPVHRDVADSLEIIRNILSTPGICAIVLKETGRPIGSVGLTWGETMRRTLPQGDGEIGYWVGTPYQGRGIAIEASRAMIAYAFEHLKLNAVWGAYYDGNESSRRVQEKCGLTYVRKEEDVMVAALAQTRTEHYMRITRDEWLQMPERHSA